MIVVIGQPVLAHVDGEPVATGSPARMAQAAASRGASVQLVGKVGEDPDGEALVLALARGGVGHVALQRDPGHPTLRDASNDSDALDSADARPVLTDDSARPVLDAADVELALRYLTEFAVIVVADQLDDAPLRVVSEAARWGSATLIVLVPHAQRVPAGLPPDAIVLGAPGDDADGAFDRLVGELAAAIEAGRDPQDAFRELIATEGWEPATT